MFPFKIVHQPLRFTVRTFSDKIKYPLPQTVKQLPEFSSFHVFFHAFSKIRRKEFISYHCQMHIRKLLLCKNFFIFDVAPFIKLPNNNHIGYPVALSQLIRLYQRLTSACNTTIDMDTHTCFRPMHDFINRFLQLHCPIPPLRKAPL